MTHVQTSPRTKDSVRWQSGLFFSMYVAFLVWLRETAKEHSALLAALGHPLWFVNRALGEPFDFSPTCIPAFHIQAAAAGLFAVIVFACFLACRWTGLTRAGVRYGVGLVAVVGPLFSPHFGGIAWDGTIFLWTRIEVAVAAAYAVLYLHARWAAKSGLPIVVLVLHLGFWGAVDWNELWHGYYWWQAALPLLLSMGTLLFWGRDVKRSSALPAPTAPVLPSGG